MFTKRLSLAGIGLATALLFSASGAAQAFPDKPLRIIVPFTAGGTADQLARSFAAGMAEELGQSIVTENRPGAGGIVAARTTVQSPADGYTLLLNTTSTLLLTPMLYKNLPYKSGDLKPLVIAAEAPLVVVTDPALPADTLEKFIDHVRDPKNKTSYASLGPGNLMQLATEILKSKTGMDDLLHIPYNGQTDMALMSVMSGENDLFVDVVSHAINQINAGKVRALAVTTLQRQPVLPDTPTLDELGYEGFRAVTYYGLSLRSDTPPELVDRLREAAHKVMGSAAFKETFNGIGLEVQPPRSGDEVAKYAQREIELWSDVIKQNNLTLD